MTQRYELSEWLWEAIKDFLPGKAGDPGRTATDYRVFFSGVLFVLITGISLDD